MKKSGTVLVIGASRGIGRELVRQYRDDGWTVHATVRKGAMQAIPKRHDDNGGFFNYDGSAIRWEGLS